MRWHRVASTLPLSCTATQSHTRNPRKRSRSPLVLRYTGAQVRKDPMVVDSQCLVKCPLAGSVSEDPLVMPVEVLPGRRLRARGQQQRIAQWRPSIKLPG
jgi:hypothetical protein